MNPGLQMDPPHISESSLPTASPSSCSLNDTWPFSVTAAGGVAAGGSGPGLRMGSLGPDSGTGSAADESTVTEQSGGGASLGRKRRDIFSSQEESSKIISTTDSGNVLWQSESNGKRVKLSEPKFETRDSKPDLGADQNNKSEPLKDYVYVRARRGQATDSHSLAERARREKISERMKILQNLVPGCEKVIGKALVLDEIINYVQSLQRQVEFLSMKLEAVNSGVSIKPAMKGFHPKDFGAEICGANRMMLVPQAAEGIVQGPLHEWLNMQVGGNFDRPSQ